MGDIHEPLTNDSGDIAIIGLACRFPGSASSPDKFWDLLSKKKSAAGIVPHDRYNVDAFHHAAGEKLNTLSAQNGHFLDEDVAAFDAPFFSITSQEATAMDPTARLLLEVTYEAMEAAGLPLESLVGSRTSCHVGCFTRDYHEMLMRDAEMAPLYAGTGTGFSLLANRISWFFDLRGASMTLDTACSSSLVGLHLACQGLRTGEATTAIVCGANLILSPDLGMWLANLRMTSTDGLSRSFAEGVTGYGRGEGIATLILKPMKDALRDGDAIRAVIRGTGVNQDGHTTGITVPNSEAQADLIRSTYRSAGLDVGQTSYFEAHGTGTAVGDPLELGAVAQAISATRDAEDPLHVGSVKSNIGHLEGAAGLAGVIKCILMFENGAIAPNIHFEKPSRRIPFEDWHIAVPTELVPWPLHKPKRASVNSFGYGGTNAHVILDHIDEWMASRAQNPLENELDHDREPRLFVVSAPAESALYRMMDRGHEFLRKAAREDSHFSLHRLAFTLSDRRSKFSWKVATVASSADELAEKWSTGQKQRQLIHTPQRARLAFIFTGQGAQYARMGIELWSYTVFRESLEAADHYLRTKMLSEWSIVAEWKANDTASQINRADLSQPLCTVLQVALVDLLRSWKVSPALVVGHSSGEIAAAYCSGALSRQDAWAVAYYRGEVCKALSGDPEHIAGAMLAVGLSVSAAQGYIYAVQTGTVVIACVNSPSSVTVSGDATGIDELKQILENAKVFCRKLKVDLAYHSHHMQRVADAYEELITRIQPITPTTQIQMISSVTGKPITPEKLGPAYWVQNLVSSVLFADAVSTLLLDNPSKRRRRTRAGECAVDFLLEIGPHSALRGPLRQILQQYEISHVPYASVLQRGENAIKSAIQSAGELYTHGLPVCIRAVNRLTITPKPLTDWPSYPWDHSRRYWTESRISRNYRLRRFGRHDLLGAAAADSSAAQPRWRNILRVQEQPWLRDHVVDGRFLLPAAGSLAMVIEAVRQLVGTSRPVESIHIEQVRITKAIVVPDDPTGVETVLQLLQDEKNGSKIEGQEDCWQFSIMSCADGLTLEQHSSGRIRVRYTIPREYTSHGRTTGKHLLWQKVREAFETVISQCSRKIEPAAFYQATHTAGLQYGPLFQGLTHITAGQDCCTAVVQITDTKASMPASAQSEHLIHPTTLDVIFHSLFAAMGSDHLDVTDAAVPIALDNLIIYPGLSSVSGTKLKTSCRLHREGSRDLVADIFVADEAAHEELRVIINGLKCRKLTRNSEAANSSSSTKAPVGTLIWKPDLAWLDGSKLHRYVVDGLAHGTTPEEQLEEKIAILVDMASHKNPDLEILQIGYSESLVECLLSALNTTDDKTMRCSSYTLLDPDADELSQNKAFIRKWGSVLSTDRLDDHVETWTESSVDVVIVYDDILSDEHFIQLKRRVRPDGLLIMQKHPNREVNGYTESISQAWSWFEDLLPSSWCIGRRNHEALKNLDQPIMLIESKNPTLREIEISHQLSLQLGTNGIHTETVQWPVNLKTLEGKSLISLLELQSRFLQNIDSDDYAALKTLMLNSKRVLWVGMGQDPAMQAAVGYLRVLRNENVNLDLRYLLLEESAGRSPESIAQTIAALASIPTTDREYMELAGCLHINRWVNDKRLDSIMAGYESTSRSDLMRLGDIQSQLRLNGSRYEAFDQKSILTNNEVQVQVVAIEMNGHSDVSAVGFSGIVTEVGTMCSRFRPGDKIWGYVCVDGPQTHIQVPESLCQILPAGVSFEQAAGWAVGLGGAYVSLVEIAHLQAGQSIFIQNAASAAGQFAVQLAQQQGGVVFVSVNTEEERNEMDALGISPRHILENDDPDLALAISRMCPEEGIHVVMHQSKDRNSLQCLWRCMAAAGTLVDLDITRATKDDKSQNGNEPALSIAPFRRGAAYSVLSVDHMLRTNPSRGAHVLSRISQLHSDRGFMRPSSVHAWKASAAGNAAQWAQVNSHHGRAVLTFSPDDRIPVTPEMANPLALNQSSTYLLIGGTGGLGANLVTFLASKGARHLAVVSRSGSSAAGAKSISQQLAKKGVQVRFYAADVSDEEVMQQVLERCAAEMPPIRGVVQCAAVLEDSIYQNMTHEQWRAATRPKIHGSIILHRLLLSQELQFFVMLSSIAGVVGNRSQANYAAGNTTQDALAHYRRSLGLPAVSVDLGLMLGIGLIAERGGETNLKKWEAVGIREVEFHALLTAAMTGKWSGSQVPTQLISGLPTGGILEADRLDRPFYFDDPRFAYLRKKDLDQSKIKADKDQLNSGLTLASQLAKVQSLREGADLVTDALKHRLARELQTVVENIDANQPLHSYGVDSLLAVEIRTWILVNMQAELSLFDVLGGGSIRVLGNRIAAASKATPSGLQ